MTENDLAKKLLDEWSKTQIRFDKKKYIDWLNFATINFPKGNKIFESLAEFCARKIQDTQKELREWKIAKMFAPRIAKDIEEKKIQNYEQDVFNLDKTIVDSVTKQVRVETAKEIFGELFKAKFLQEKKTK